MKLLRLLPASLALVSVSAMAAPLKVASLNTVLTDIAENVGGNRVEITTIVQPGVDPHMYEPTPGDIRKISNARIVLASGLGFEGYLDNLKSSVGAGPVFVVAGDAIQPIYVDETDAHDEGEGEEHGHHHYLHTSGDGGKYPDPHWWHSIRNVQAVTRQIRDAFIVADPEGRSIYEANARTFDKKLTDLSKWVRLQLAKLPKDKRILVTSHDALGYFAQDYGFEIHPVQGISTSDQPSSKKVRELVSDIKDEGVRAIFAENIENPKVLQQITQETGAKLGGTLYADGLGTGDAGTYDGMMRHNVTTIVTALQ